MKPFHTTFGLATFLASAGGVEDSSRPLVPKAYTVPSSSVRFTWPVPDSASTPYSPCGAV